MSSELDRWPQVCYRVVGASQKQYQEERCPVILNLRKLLREREWGRPFQKGEARRQHRVREGMRRWGIEQGRKWKELRCGGLWRSGLWVSWSEWGIVEGICSVEWQDNVCDSEIIPVAPDELEHGDHLEASYTLFPRPSVEANAEREGHFFPVPVSNTMDFRVICMGPEDPESRRG